MELYKALSLLKKVVKESNIKGQMHVDLTLAPAQDLPHYRVALVTVRNAIQNKQLSEDEAKHKMGID